MMSAKRKKEERDFYEDCNGFKALIDFRTYQKLAYDRASVAEKNKGMVKVQSSDGMQTEYHLSKKEIYEAYKHEFQIWVRDDFD